MINQHPIIPPLELLDKWNNLSLSTQEIFVIVAQWGADQELEACCQHVQKDVTEFTSHAHLCAQRKSDGLRAARRRKPPSLKEQALNGLEKVESFTLGQLSGVSVFDEYKTHVDNIRRALKALPE
jgi:hypothetical protein